MLSVSLLLSIKMFGLCSLHNCCQIMMLGLFIVSPLLSINNIYVHCVTVFVSVQCLDYGQCITVVNEQCLNYSGLSLDSQCKEHPVKRKHFKHCSLLCNMDIRNIGYMEQFDQVPTCSLQQESTVCSLYHCCC